MSKYEVATGDYYRLRKRAPNTSSMILPHGHLPLTMIKGPGAIGFGPKILQGFEEKEGGMPKGWEYRLPTEAEWEYAAWAGSSTRDPFGDSAATLFEYANFAERSLLAQDGSAHWADIPMNDGIGARPVPVGSYRSNPWGIHDMLGNVSKFVVDHYQEALPGGTDPLVQAKGGSSIALRGGAWCSTADNCDPSFRLSTRLSNNDGNTTWRGLRVILAPVN